MNNAGHFLQPALQGHLPWLYVATWWWSGIGFAGNILFGSRFILQWIESERKNSLVVPAYFWQLSFWGSILNLIYAFHLDSAPLLLGVAALPFIYGRNLVLLKRTKAPTTEKHVETLTATPSRAAA